MPPAPGAGSLVRRARSVALLLRGRAAATDDAAGFDCALRTHRGPAAHRGDEFGTGVKGVRERRVSPRRRAGLVTHRAGESQRPQRRQRLGHVSCPGALCDGRAVRAIQAKAIPLCHAAAHLRVVLLSGSEREARLRRRRRRRPRRQAARREQQERQARTHPGLGHPARSGWPRRGWTAGSTPFSSWPAAWPGWLIVGLLFMNRTMR